MKSAPFVSEDTQKTWMSGTTGLVIGLLSMFAWPALLAYLFAPFVFKELLNLLKIN